MKPGTKILILLTAINYLNYIDRYILAAVLSSIKSDLVLSDLQAGLLATAFMIPYVLTSPLFGYIGDRFKRPRILSFSVLLWSVASLVTGLSKSFATIMTSRFSLGFGESAFTVISIPYISDHFDIKKQGRTLAIFSTALPVGAALGYVLGGALGKAVGWRGAFFVVGFPGIIMALLLSFLSDPRTQRESAPPIWQSFLGLIKVKSYTFAVLGYCGYSFVVGGFAHWIPSYMQRTFQLDQMKSNLVFGGIAVVTGLAGTLFGGYFADWWGVHKRGAHMLTSGYSMLIAFPFFLLCALSDSLLMFSIFMALTQFFFFVSTAPINVAVLDAAPSHLRTSAMAIAIFSCHVLGDAISSPLIGFLSDKTGSLRTGMLVCAPFILLSSIFWVLAGRLNRGNGVAHEN